MTKTHVEPASHHHPEQIEANEAKLLRKTLDYCLKHGVQFIDATANGEPAYRTATPGASSAMCYPPEHLKPTLDRLWYEHFPQFDDNATNRIKVRWGDNWFVAVAVTTDEYRLLKLDSSWKDLTAPYSPIGIFTKPLERKYV